MTMIQVMKFIFGMARFLARIFGMMNARELEWYLTEVVQSAIASARRLS